MEIRELLAAERVAWNIQATSKKRALEILSEMLARDGEGGPEPADIFGALVHRERLGSTAVGQGAALPHGRLPGLGQPLGALIRLVEPVDYDAADKQAVDLLFGLVVPDSASDEDLASLKAIAARFKDAAVLAALRGAHSSAEAYHVITQPAAVRRASA